MSSILDRGGSRRRLQLSTSMREISASPLNARAPLTGLCMGQVRHVPLSLCVLPCVLMVRHVLLSLCVLPCVLMVRHVPLLHVLLLLQWLNLCLDLSSLVSGLFKGQTFKSLEGISIGGSCMLRRLFTLRSCPQATLGSREEGATEGIPRACQMPGGSVAVETQVRPYK